MGKLLYNDKQYAGAVTPQPEMCPIGKIDMYAGSNAPNGWLLCRGQAVSRTAYADLFAVIGTTYGTGDGSTTFNVPDLCDRVPVGAGNSYLLNDNGGATSNSYTPSGSVGNHTLTIDQVPGHNHSTAVSFKLRGCGNNGEGNNPIVAGDTNSSVSITGGGGNLSTLGWGNYARAMDKVNLTTGSTNKGGGQAHSHGFTGTTSAISTMQPYRAINFIIYYGTTV